MIRIKKKNYRIENYAAEIIKERMIKETCKTNLSPQLIFRQSYTGFTFKTFVGNWTKTGFWISNFRLQLMQLRPDIIARFNFQDTSEACILSIRYSIGFSSIFFGLVWIMFFSAPFAIFGLAGYLTGWALMTGLYILLSVYAYNNIRIKIDEKLLLGIQLYSAN